MATTTRSPSTLATVFRVVAIAEACSWTGLLIGMVFKAPYLPPEPGALPPSARLERAEAHG